MPKMPKMEVCVVGGNLTQAAFKAIEEFVEKQIRGEGGMLVLEAESKPYMPEELPACLSVKGREIISVGKRRFWKVCPKCGARFDIGGCSHPPPDQGDG